MRGEDFWTVARYKSSARIAAGMYPSLEILPEAIERAERSLRDFAGRNLLPPDRCHPVRGDLGRQGCQEPRGRSRETDEGLGNEDRTPTKGSGRGGTVFRGSKTGSTCMTG
jgi:hypothetical protein